METNTNSGSGSASSVVGAGSSGTAPVKVLTGFRLRLQQMLAGVQALIPDGASTTTPGGSLTKAQIVSKLMVGMSDFEAVDAGLTALGVARLQLRDDLPELETFYSELKDSLSVQFGKRSPLLAQFGLKPQQLRKVMTPETRVARAEKARQTRMLRHTGGVRQKAQVLYEGTVKVNTVLRPAQAVDTSSAPSADVSPGVTTPGKPAETPPAGSG